MHSVEGCEKEQEVYNGKNSGYDDQNSNSVNNSGSGDVKINCSYSSGNYKFDYGQLTYDECTIKSDQYWASEKQKIADSSSANFPTSIPTTYAGKSQAEIDRCKSEVQAKYNNLIRGCYIIYQGSASDVCARVYQAQSGAEMQGCY